MKSQGAEKNAANNAAQAESPVAETTEKCCPEAGVIYCVEEQVNFDIFSKSDFRVVKVKACEPEDLIGKTEI